MAFGIGVGEAGLAGLRTALMQSRDPKPASAKVLIYSIVLEADCDF